MELVGDVVVERFQGLAIGHLGHVLSQLFRRGVYSGCDTNGLCLGDLRDQHTYAQRAAQHRDRGDSHAIIGGANYGQGSSRENAAIAPRYLGAQIVVAQSFARIHWQNLINFGVLPLTFVDPSAYERLHAGDTIRIPNIGRVLTSGEQCVATVDGSSSSITLQHNLSERQIEILMAGGAINWRDNHRTQ
jgi:aconitase A